MDRTVGDDRIHLWLGRTDQISKPHHTSLGADIYVVYKSCPEKKQKNYSALVAELTTRFTPVRIRSVQSSLFHGLKQQHSKETVDDHAQDLHRLFYLAYPRAQQGTQEAEDMGQSVLSYQFVAGL